MAAGPRAKNTGSNRSKKKRERWVWNEESLCVLNSLRELVATGTPLSGEILPKFDYAVKKILTWYQHWVIQRSLFDKKRNSVAGKVMNHLAAKQGRKVVEEWYRESRDRGRRAFFDCLVRTVLVSRGGIVSNDLNDAVMIREFVEDPEVLHFEEAVLEWFVDASKKHGEKFLLDVAADKRNFDERVDKMDLNALLFEVTRHWDDCHCPMWLMSRKAILKAAKAFAPGNTGWSEESLKRVLRDVDLSGSAKRPIEDVVIKNGKIAGFYVKADVISGAEPTLVSFKPKGASKSLRYFIVPKAVEKRKSVVRVGRRGKR